MRTVLPNDSSILTFSSTEKIPFVKWMNQKWTRIEAFLGLLLQWQQQLYNYFQ